MCSVGGYALSRKRVAYPVVANYVGNTWDKYGLVKSMLNSSTGLFLFQFSSVDGLDSMLENEDVGNVGGFAVALAVLITGASQSRQHDTLVRLPMDIRLKIDLGKSVVIMEYLVKDSKRRAFWSLNEDTLKITILKTNTPYPSRKIRHIKRGPYSKKSPIRRIQCLGYAVGIQCLGYACMTRSSANELFTPYKEPEREFRSSRRYFKTLSLDELRSPDFNLLSNQEYSEEEVAETMAEIMEQYMSKTRADYGSRVSRPKIEDKDNFELKGQFLKELRTNTFIGSDHEDANEHIEKVLEIVDLFHIPNITIDQVMLRAFLMSLTGAVSHWLRNKPTGSITTWEDLKTKFLSKYCPPACTAKKMTEINNFQQEPDENLYQAWERFKEILMKCPQYYLMKIQEVVVFYNGLDVPTRQILDSRGVIPSKTTTDTKIAIQEMVEYSQKWHNVTSRVRSIDTSDGLTAIQAQLNNLGRELKKVNEKVFAAQVGCEQCKGPHYTKDFPLKEEGKTLEEAYYTQYGRPFQGGGYRATAPGYYQRNNANHSHLDNHYCEEEEGNYGPKFAEAYGASHINGTIPRKEKDPWSFTLPCYINNICFDNALVDLGASVSVMPLLTYLNLGLGELAHTKLTVELADRTVKYPKGIAENVLVGIGKVIEESRTRDEDLDTVIEDYPRFEFTHVNYFPLLYVNVMSKKFHNSIMKDKMMNKGDNVVETLMNVSIFVGTFSIVTDFAVLENMDAYHDEGMGEVIVGEPFLREVGIKQNGLME
ncbi:reverse transcriptase domain-containing protein [Tanacetum coccineum]